MYLHVKRIPIEDVPVEETLFKKWMHDLFVGKDE